MFAKKSKPRIPGLTEFEERATPTGIGYLGDGLAVVAVSITRKQFDAYIAGFNQLPDVETAEVSFGPVSGWRMKNARGLGYVLQVGGDFALLNVDPRGAVPVDPLRVESFLHTLCFS